MESPFTLKLRRFFRSCKTKKQRADVVVDPDPPPPQNPHHLFPRQQLSSPPKPRTVRRRRTFFRPDPCGQKYPPAPTILPPYHPTQRAKKKTKKKKKKTKMSRSHRFNNDFARAFKYNTLFSSDDDDDGDEERRRVLFSSSRSLSSSGSSRRRRSSRRRNPVTGDCVAVVKRSADPYGDFVESMVEMIVEKEIVGGRELEKLLECFLSLNSHHHHGIIIDAFTHICEALFSTSEF
ncbi:hypothetical protein DM860_003428 [Cuscuta australis]|uniref:Transcription repressor n=1 Tax=Cuscuta australis TaxID=267555 RepID=A0A328DK29_9ASTE|nr:hypothetical protein DM860_003428 [Cuscuta australis]